MRPLDERDVAILRVIEGLRTVYEWVPLSSIIDKVPFPEGEVQSRLRFLKSARLIRYSFIGFYNEFAAMLLERGFDMLALWDFKRHGVIEEVADTIGEGKEAEIVLASSKQGDVVIKFHRYWSVEFKHIRRSLSYAAVKLRGEELNLEDSKIDIPRAKAQVEMKAMEAAYKAGVTVPKPLSINRHAVVMEFVSSGYSGMPAPRIVDTRLQNPRDALDRILQDVETLVVKAGFIHGDLNEYNILISGEGDLYFIDFPQAVPVSYDRALMLLERDLSNIFNFFSKEYGIHTPNAAETARSLMSGI